MKRREYLEKFSAVATAPLALSAAEQAAQDLTEESQLLDELTDGNREIYRRGVEGEILVIRDKPELVEDSKLTIRNTHTGEVVDYIHIYQDFPRTHIGECHSIVFTKFDGQKYSCFVPYYDEIKLAEKGWISVDNTI
jgi:hypothetical protein